MPPPKPADCRDAPANINPEQAQAPRASSERPPSAATTPQLPPPPSREQPPPPPPAEIKSILSSSIPRTLQTVPKMFSKSTHLEKSQSSSAPKPDHDPKREIDEPRSILRERERLIDELERCRQLESHYESIKREYDHLKSENYRQEVLSIRRHLQVHDLREPWEISQQFGEITRKVEDISRNLGEFLGASPQTRELKTTDFSILSQLYSSRSPPAIAPVFEVDAESFIDFGCRALINQVLMETIFNPNLFHYSLKQQDNQLFQETYSRIRKQEPQVIAGRWRVSTFNLYAGNSYPSKDDARRACESLIGPFCRIAYEQEECQKALGSIFPDVVNLFERADAWNSLAKSSVIMLDFHPHFCPPGSQFDDQVTTLEGRRPKPPASNTILLTSKLGLLSSQAVGGAKEPECIVQTKAMVLAAEYFV